MTNVIDTAVASVAVLVDDDRFDSWAAEVARQLGPAAIPELSTRFHSPPRPEPAGFGAAERGLGGWMAAWQRAVFELFFQFGADALPVLRQVVSGPYDWIQGNAVEVLVRLAAAGVARDEVVADVRRAFPGLRFEATLYAVGPLLYHAARDPAVAAVIRDLEDLPAWRAAVAERGPVDSV